MAGAALPPPVASLFAPSGPTAVSNPRVPSVISAGRASAGAGGEDPGDDDCFTLNTQDMPKVHTFGPHRVVGYWTDLAGIDHVTVIWAVTAGNACDTTGTVQVDLDESGTGIVIHECWSEYMYDMNTFYSLFDEVNEEDKDAFYQRRFAMCAAVRKMQREKGLEPDDNMWSNFRIQLEKKMDPSTLETKFIATEDGHRVCHIDLASRKKEVAANVTVVSKRKRNTMVPNAPKKKQRFSRMTGGVMTMNKKF